MSRQRQAKIATPERICRTVHALLHQLPLWHEPAELPFRNGLYFFYERGERSHHGPNGRIVRIGNHPHSQGRLQDRLWDHYALNKNSSVLRRFLGGALLRRTNANHPCLRPAPGKGHWEQGNASPCRRCRPLEARVSRLLRERFSFRCVAIGHQARRSIFEKKLIGSLARCTTCSRPSAKWLGRHAYRDTVQSSGLWNVHHLRGPDAMSWQDLNIFKELVMQTRRLLKGTAPAKARRDVERIRGTLVIVACGKAKIWEKRKRAGPTRAEEVYCGAPFKVNKEYAKRWGSRWVILSAKYGYIDPSFNIPGPYNVTFKALRTHPVRLRQLKRQVASKRLDRYQRVVGLGGAEYRGMIRGSFSNPTIRLDFPTQGLPLGKAMRRIKRALAQGRHLPAGRL